MVINLSTKYNLLKEYDSEVKNRLTEASAMDPEDKKRKALMDEAMAISKAKAELTTAQSSKLKVITGAVIGAAWVGVSLYQTGLGTVYSEEHPITSKFFSIVRPKERPDL